MTDFLVPLKKKKLNTKSINWKLMMKKSYYSRFLKEGWIKANL